MINLPLAKLLATIADLLELSGDNPFRIRAFRRAAQLVEGHPEDLGALGRDAWLEIPGIGKGIADIIEEFRATGTSVEFEQLRKKFPDGVLQMMTIGGLGPKRAAILYKELRIDSVPKLTAALEKGVVTALPGFGKKLVENIAANLKRAPADGPVRMLVPEARRLARSLEAFLNKSPDIDRLELAGSARRWKETVGDLDFVCISRRPEKAIRKFLSCPGVEKTLGAGDTKASVVLTNGLQCDFRVVPPESFGAALLYFTGSKEHNVRLRERAQRRGLTLNEYGLFKTSDTAKRRPLAGRTEEDVYAKLGLRWIAPELREDRGEVEAAEKGTLPRLIEMSDVLGDMHNHTDLTDGANTLEEMVEAARARGWAWFFSADHSPSLTIAKGIGPAALRKKMERVRKLDRPKGMRVFTSSEVDILADGKLDYDDAVLEELGCVVASVHSRFNQPGDVITERICRALRNPRVDVLGHITGRLINKRPSYAVDVEAVLQAAKDTQTAIEINGQPDRAELNDVQVKRAVELGVPLAVSTDAHSTRELDHMELAVHIARRGWAEPKHIINTKSTDALVKWLEA